MAKVKKWYVVTVGKEVGVFDTWLETAPLVKGVNGAVWEGFTEEDEAIRLFAEQQARGNVKRILTGQSLRQEIPRSSSVPVVGTSHASPLPRSHSVFNTGAVSRGAQWIQNFQNVTPPQSPRLRPDNAEHRRMDNVDNSPTHHRGNGPHGMHWRPSEGNNVVRTSSSRSRSYSQVERREHIAPFVPPASSHYSSNGRRTNLSEQRTVQREVSNGTSLYHSSRAVRSNRHLEEQRAPIAAYDDATSISAPLMRGRRSSSISSSSTGTAVTSVMSLVESLGSEDSVPYYPDAPAPHLNRAPTSVPERRASRSATPGSSPLDFSKVTIRSRDHGSPRSISSRSTPRNPPPPRALSPLNFGSPNSLPARTLPVRERVLSTPTRSFHAQNSSGNSSALRSPVSTRANGDARPLPVVEIHDTDSEPEDDVGDIPMVSQSAFPTRRQPYEQPMRRADRIAYVAARWVSLDSSPIHVRSESHDAGFDPRSPMARGTRVPIDATSGVFSRPSPRILLLDGGASTLLIR